MDRVRVAEDDPTRCQAVFSLGQCNYQAILPGKYCSMHGGAIEAHQGKKEAVKNYRLTKFRARVNEFAESDEVKSLREEIGIIRLLIEETMNRCQDTADLLIHSGKISSLIQQVQKLVVACHQLEERTGRLIDKPTVIVLCDSLVKIIANYVDDPDALDQIAVQFLENVAKVGGLNDVIANVRANA